jgi:proteasome accessory factor B
MKKKDHSRSGKTQSSRAKIPMTSQAGRLARPPLARMLKIHEALKEETYPNCRSLATELEVVDKTIQRDLEFMRDQLNLPIAFVPARNGYAYTESVVSFPTVQVGEGELLALVVAQRALAQYKGTVWADRLQAACQRLASSMQGEVSFNLGEWDSLVSFHAVGTADLDLDVFERTSRALAESREIVFQYRKLQGKNFEERRLQPHHLACVDGQWYLLGYDPERGEARTFVLIRMREVRLTDRKFKRPEGHREKALRADSFGIFSGGKIRKVVLMFRGLSARLVAEKGWHPTQKLRERSDGSVEVTFRLSHFLELKRWVLSWGGEAEVLEPDDLRAEIREEFKRGLSIYNVEPSQKFKEVRRGGPREGRKG